MELSQEAIDYLEQQIPELAELATRQAFWQTLASGHSVTVSEGSNLVEIFPDGTKKVVGHIVPASKVSKRQFIIPN